MPTEDDAIGGVRILRSLASLRATVAALRASRPGLRIALVPTMGALHEAHLRLCDQAHALADVVIVSIFVNPQQFAAHEDLDSYPRSLEADCAKLARRDVDWVFAPSVAEMYPLGFQTRVEVPALAAGLCGVSRPHFFAGVALVVLKLLNAVMADVAVFGEKDWQQLQVVRRLAGDLNHPTEVVGAPLLRDDDGLALSSRNVYLSPAERQRALSLGQSLRASVNLVAAGQTDAAPLIAAATASITAAGGVVDYVAIVDPLELTAVTTIEAEVRMLVAATFGKTRLIDNRALLPAG